MDDHGKKLQLLVTPNIHRLKELNLEIINRCVKEARVNNTNFLLSGREFVFSLSP